MKITGPAALLLLAALIAGCSNDLDRRYLDASVGERLELPPDLIETDSESSFELPDSIIVDDGQVAGQRPVLARVESLQLQGSGDLYWLSVEEPVGNLYRMVKSFWASEGFRLLVDEPAIGIMQTEWIYKEEGAEIEPDNWFLNLFDSKDLSASQDQFRTRIERGSEGGNRIYITHRGTEYIHVLEGGRPSKEEPADNEWRFRQSDPELEVEMLSRLMLYLGLQQAEVDQQVTNAGLFEARAFMHLDSEENSPYLVVKDPYQIAWNRVLHNLERMNFEIESQDPKSRLLGGGVISVKTHVRDSSSEGGFFSSFTTPETRDRKIFLVLSEDSNEYTRVDIENSDGDFDSSPEGAEFMRLLYRSLK